MRALSSGDRRLLLTVTVAAFLVRLIYVLESRDSPFFSAPVVDAQAFLTQARDIAQGDLLGGGEPFWQPPLYPYFLALFCWLLPDHVFLAARLAQAALGASSCALVFIIARAAATPVIAGLAAAAVAAYGPLIYFEGELLGVALEVPLYLLLVLLFIRGLERPSPGAWARAGVTAGLAAIARPNVLLFVATFCLLLPRFEKRLGRPFHGRRLARQWLAIGLPCALIVAPVTLRNLAMDRDLVLISANGGINFYIGNNAAYDSTVAIHPGAHWEDLVMEPVRHGYEGPAARSTYFYRRALSYLTSEPIDYARLLLRKLWLFWDGPEIKRNQDVYYARRHSSLLSALLWDWGLSFPFGLVGPLALLGLGLTWRRWSPTLAVLRVFALSYGGSVVLFFVTSRYRAPAVPVLAIFAAWAAVEMARRTRQRQWRQLSIPGGVVVALVLALNLGSAPSGEDDAQLFHDLGEVHLRQGNAQAAVEHSRRALALDPTYASAHHNAAVAYMSLGRPREALKHLRAAIVHNPHRADTRVVGARVHMALGDWREAGRELQRALEIDPELPAAHAYYGQLLLKGGQPGRALTHLERAVRSLPNDFWTTYDLGRAHHGAGHLDEALQAFAAAGRIDPTRPEAPNAAGAVCIQRGDRGAARAHFQRAMALDGENQDARINMGILDIEEGQFDRGIELLHSVLPRVKNPTPLHLALLRAYAATGRETEAERIRGLLGRSGYEP